LAESITFIIIIVFWLNYNSQKCLIIFLQI